MSAASAISPWDWSQHPWPTGSLAQTYHLVEDGIDVTISVSTTTLENPIPPTLPTFASWDGLSPLATCTPVLSPNLDGAGSPSNRFGTNLDLGIVYDPAASRDQSVLIDIKFTQLNSGPNGPAVAIPNFKFEISDVDWSAGGVECIRHTSQGFRRDQVVITAMNHGVEVTDFSLSPSPANTSPTFLIEPYNVATAIVGSESNTDEKGTVVVNFSSTPVTDVTIIYNEAGYDLNTNNDPGYRGIGILGGMTSLPVELMDFSIE
ncbi:MAG TPA: hypothetical protein VN851_23585 [Thermoanaerobaculia bacterium]|nr:hypothetical protein [Thermoanaerobaculia bacterium]